jgi:hypothetical protein
VKGFHFYTIGMQYAALIVGGNVAQFMKDEGAYAWYLHD